MLRKLLVPALALAVLPSIASAQFEAGDFEFTLAGNGSAPMEGRGGAVAAQGGLGYFLSKELEVGIRQNFEYFDPGAGESGDWGGKSGGFADFHFDLGALQPFVGVEGGYAYPAGAEGSPYVTPEAGVKYFVNGTTFVFARVGYVYTMSETDDSVFEGTAGVGFRF